MPATTNISTTPLRHIGTTWQIRLSLCFLRATRVHNQNCKSIGSAISAQLTEECHWACPSMSFAIKLPLRTGIWKPIQYMVPWVHPIQHPKQQLDPFSQLCTAPGRHYLHFTVYNRRPFPPKIATCRGRLDCHLTDGSLGPFKPKTQTASRLVQPFLHNSLQCVPILFNGPHLPSPLKTAPFHGDVDPHLIYGPWAHPSPQPTRHLDRFSHFYRAHYCIRQTNRQTDTTDHATGSVTIGHIYVRSMGNKAKKSTQEGTLV